MHWLISVMAPDPLNKIVISFTFGLEIFTSSKELFPPQLLTKTLSDPSAILTVNVTPSSLSVRAGEGRKCVRNGTECHRFVTQP
jgi:hypothetical protein